MLYNYYLLVISNVLTCFCVPHIRIAIFWACDNKAAACAESAADVFFEVGSTKVALHDGIAP